MINYLQYFFPRLHSFINSEDQPLTLVLLICFLFSGNLCSSQGIGMLMLKEIDTHNTGLITGRMYFFSFLLITILQYAFPTVLAYFNDGSTESFPLKAYQYGVWGIDIISFLLVDTMLLFSKDTFPVLMIQWFRNRTKKSSSL